MFKNRTPFAAAAVAAFALLAPAQSTLAQTTSPNDDNQLLISQIQSTAKIATTSPATLINSLIILVGVVAGLIALLETKEQTGGAMKPVVSLGRTYLMAFFCQPG